MVRQSLALLAALLLVSAAPLPAETPPPPASETLALGADRSDRMTVMVTIHGQGPYPFVVDTGSERTIISDTLAATLGLQPAGVVQVHSMTGVHQIATVEIDDLKIGSNRARDIKALMLPTRALGVLGILGIDSLKSKRIILDFKEKRMTITPAEMRRVRADPDTIVVKARRRLGRLLLVGATAKGRRIDVILDTGTQVSVGNMALRRHMLGTGPAPESRPITLIGVTGDHVTAEFVPVRRLKIDRLVLGNMPIAFADVHPFRQLDMLDRPALLLGMNSLRAFDQVSVDFPNRKVQFVMPGELALGVRPPLALAGW